jgi:hypothetical protein
MGSKLPNLRSTHCVSISKGAHNDNFATQNDDKREYVEEENWMN